jgi:hypothetical protein
VREREGRGVLGRQSVGPAPLAFDLSRGAVFAVAVLLLKLLLFDFVLLAVVDFLLQLLQLLLHLELAASQISALVTLDARADIHAYTRAHTHLLPLALFHRARVAKLVDQGQRYWSAVAQPFAVKTSLFIAQLQLGVLLQAGLDGIFGAALLVLWADMSRRT